VLDVLEAPFDWQRFNAGMSAYEQSGDPLPKPMLENIRETKLALKAPLTTPVGKGFRSANVRLREEFNLYANVRPAISYIRGGRFEDIDLVLIRENTEGLYVGVEHYIPIDGDPKAVAEASGIITRSGCRRIAKFAFDYAVRHNRKKVTIVHKANILKALTGLFLETATEIGKAYQDTLLIEERIVDNCAMQLVINPSQFDVILTTNMFGDILSDEIAGLVGGLGLAPGGNIGNDAAIFEAVHGSAPDIAGKGIANPTALMLAAAMMLEHTNHYDKAARLKSAISNVLEEKHYVTADLGGKATTNEYTDEVIKKLES
jgi:isocitrate dehydrogenase (NAD+)